MKRLALLTSLAVASGMLLSSAFAAKSGSLKIAGSTTVLPLSQVWAEAYSEKNPQVDISVSGGGSGTGLSMLLNGTCHVANASRDAKPKEFAAAKARNAQLVCTKLAKDGLAIVVHPSNPIKSLTIKQIGDIYTGKINNWKQVGGPNRQIVAIGRDTSSGTYGFFQEAVLGGNRYRRDMLALASNAAVAQGVAQSEGGIGYIGLAFAAEGERSTTIRIVGVSAKAGQPAMEPTDELVQSGKYPLFR